MAASPGTGRVLAALALAAGTERTREARGEIILEEIRISSSYGGRPP